MIQARPMLHLGKFRGRGSRLKEGGRCSFQRLLKHEMTYEASQIAEQISSSSRSIHASRCLRYTKSPEVWRIERALGGQLRGDTRGPPLRAQCNCNPPLAWLPASFFILTSVRLTVASTSMQDPALWPTVAFNNGRFSTKNPASQLSDIEWRS